MCVFAGCTAYGGAADARRPFRRRSLWCELGTRFSTYRVSVAPSAWQYWPKAISSACATERCFASTITNSSDLRHRVNSNSHRCRGPSCLRRWRPSSRRILRPGRSSRPRPVPDRSLTAVRRRPVAVERPPFPHPLNPGRRAVPESANPKTWTPWPSIWVSRVIYNIINLYLLLPIWLYIIHH